MSDLIDRQAAIDMLRDYLVGKRCPDDGTLTCRLIENEVINKLPPAQPKRERRKIGEWIYDFGDWDFETCKCSECGNHMTTPIGKRYSFCPHCGSDMEVTT